MPSPHLGGRLDWLSPWFLPSHTPGIIPFGAVLLARLRPIAAPRNTNAVSRATAVSLLCWIAASVHFLYSYFDTFAPSYLYRYAYPEGKYGPPLLRAEPFHIISFGVVLAVVGFFKMVWRHRNAIIYHVDVEESPRLAQLAWDRLRVSATRTLSILGVSFALLYGQNLVMMPLPYLIYALVVGSFQAIRRSSFTFFEYVTDLRLAYNLLWAGCALLLLHTVIESIVEFYFGRCFKICQGTVATRANPTPYLLEGLRSGKTAVQSQAILELRYMLFQEPLWRASLFTDFIGEEACSRTVCNHLIKLVRDYSRHIATLNGDLRLATTRLDQRSEEEQPPRALPELRSDSSIFSPRRRNIIESILSPTPAATPRRATSGSKGQDGVGGTGIPDFLEIKPSSRRQHEEATNRAVSALQESPAPSETRQKYQSQYVQLIILLFARFANSFPGRVYAGFGFELVKSWWLHEEEALIWALDCLSGLVVASYDEDAHGQIQFVLDQVLLALCELHEALQSFIELPRIQGRRLLEDLFGNQASPTERRARQVELSAIGVIESIVDKFTDSLGQISISPETKGKMDRLGISW